MNRTDDESSTQVVAIVKDRSWYEAEVDVKLARNEAAAIHNIAAAVLFDGVLQPSTYDLAKSAMRKLRKAGG